MGSAIVLRDPVVFIPPEGGSHTRSAVPPEGGSYKPSLVTPKVLISCEVFDSCGA
jgi:hypothetical protein